MTHAVWVTAGVGGQCSGQVVIGRALRRDCKISVRLARDTVKERTVRDTRRELVEEAPRHRVRRRDGGDGPDGGERRNHVAEGRNVVGRAMNSGVILGLSARANAMSSPFLHRVSERALGGGGAVLGVSAGEEAGGGDGRRGEKTAHVCRVVKESSGSTVWVEAVQGGVCDS